MVNKSNNWDMACGVHVLTHYMHQLKYRRNRQKKEAYLSKLYRELNNPLHYYAHVVLLLKGVEVNEVSATDFLDPHNQICYKNDGLAIPFVCDCAQQGRKDLAKAPEKRGH